MTASTAQTPIDTTNRIARLRAYLADNDLDGMIVRSNANLRWLTGAQHTFDTELAHTALITQDHLFFRTDSRYLQTFYEHLGKDTIWEFSEGQDSHEAWLAAELAKIGAARAGIEDSISIAFLDALLKASGERNLFCNYVHTHSVIEDLRIVKDEQELCALRKAQEVTDLALQHMIEYLEPGQTEQQIRNELESFMLAHGADAISFDSIIAAGSNGALPHAQPSARPIQKGDLVVIDFGALVDDYHADMTRTFSIGQPSEEQRRAYEVVKTAHEKAAAAVKPDVNGAYIHSIAQDVIAQAGYGDYFKHGLGHGVGIEIHENPGFRPAWDKPVPRNSVVTIEPGVYLPTKFGIRLEDTGVVTQKGFEPFTSYNHDLIVIDA